MSTPSADTPVRLASELLAFAVLLFLTFTLSLLLCPYILLDVLLNTWGNINAPFRQVMMLGFFWGVPLAWMLCCLALRPARKKAYFLSLAFYIVLSYVYGHMLFACYSCRLLSLSDAYLLILIFPMLHHLLWVPFLLLFNAWLSFGKLPVAPMTARRFGRRALVALAVLWSIAAVATLLPQL